MRLQRIWLVALLVFFLSACAASRLEKLEVVTRAYDSAIRWSDFNTAFAIAGNRDAPVPDFSRLQNIRITSYDKMGAPQVDEDGVKLSQIVEIGYVNVNNMSERRLTDRQEWVYVEKEGRWKLTTPIPSFR